MRLLLAVLLAAVALPVGAQPTDGGVLGLIDNRQATAGGYYFNAQPGQPIRRVNVWGDVRYPGVYDVGPDFDLKGVVTLSGVTVTRDLEAGDPDTVLRLFRAGESTPVYEATVAEFVRDASLPDLRYGDVVEVRSEGVARVAVWGAVARPGIYEVGPGLTARDAVALAGGPVLQPLDDSESRTTTVQVFRGDATGAPAYKQTLQAFLSAPPPDLVDGDVIQIESTVSQGWTNRDTFAVLGIATSGAIAVVQFLRLIQSE